MSTAARIHKHASNRAKPGETLENKVVFKSVLDSPFRVPWPSVPVNIQNEALECTVSLLKGVSEYQSSKRKRKQLNTSLKPSKRRKISEDTTAMLVESTLPASDSSLPARPAVLQHLSIGINEVTKRLDAQIRSLRRCNVVSLNTDPATEQPPLLAPIKLIVVCRADVDPQILIDHLPHEVAAFNSAQPPEPIKIIPLPKGAEASLAAAAGFRRVAVIAMDIETPGLAAFTSILDSVPTLAAPWLTSIAPSAPPVKKQLIPTHVKQLRTTAPKDMKLAKSIRAEGKATARKQAAARKAKIAEVKARVPETN
ncbi:hypothetical protein GGX14DRAFT_349878 [Mycena pura]|uniref:Uncharacterized protein n=1 Tax=Mycena pura TaxID=153505 RepID=A0AAD6YPJ5_9AGAR|nr:hypothetical protein GGX14DRAFT_349878 [Mycena pura]